MRNVFRAFTAFFLAFAMAFYTVPVAAQTTRILDGSYVTKFGRFRNYVINPDAQVNAVDGTTRSNTTLLRSTTTPISENGTTEFNVTFNSSTNSLDFNTSGATQANLGGQMCEVGFRGRGFQATSQLQAWDGTNVLASVTFGLLAITQEISLTFPCPLDPSTVKPRIKDSATLSGTNEIAGVYFGRARNLATAAQAEHVGTLTYAAATNCQWTNTSNYPAVGSYALDSDCGTPSVTGSLTAASTKIPGFTMNVTPGRYYIRASGVFSSSRASQGDTLCNRLTDGTSSTSLQCTAGNFGGASSANISQGVIVGEIEYTSSAAVTVQVQGGNDGSSTNIDARAVPVTFSVFRLPAASAIISSPAQQNVYGVRKWDGNQGSPARNTNAYLAFSDATLASNVTNTGSATACASSSNLCIKIPNLPAGEYRADITATMVADAAGTVCSFGLSTTNSNVGLFSTYELQGDAATNLGWSSHAHGFFTVTSQADTEIYVVGNRISGNICTVAGGSSSRRITLSVTPANRSPSPVYIQAPVRGDTSGVAPGSTFVGFVVDGSVSEANAVTTTGSTCGTLAIPSAGTWDIRWQTKSVNSASPAGVVRVQARVTTDAAYLPTITNAFADTLIGGLMHFNVSAGTTDGTMGGEFTVTTTGAATYYTRVAWSGNTGGSMGVRCPMQAVRRN